METIQAMIKNLIDDFEQQKLDKNKLTSYLNGITNLSYIEGLRLGIKQTREMALDMCKIPAKQLEERLEDQITPENIDKFIKENSEIVNEINAKKN